MKKLQHAYVHTPHSRVISASDFKAAGVEDQGKVEWGPSNRHIAEISDEAAAKLLELEPGEWKLVDESTSSGGSTFEPLGSGEDDDETPDSGSSRRTTRQRTSNS